MISDSSALTDLIGRLAKEPRIALDTEADSLHSYFEKLCLIQLSIPGCDELIDPLAGIDLQPLFSAIEGRRIVFHGADYDLRLIARVLSFQPADLFDTMIAARLCGLKELGLAALVEKYFGVKLSKASQKANWAIRPLSPQMLEYAVNDTRYLLDLSEYLVAELNRLGRWDWFAESRDRMIASAREIKVRDDNKAWRISGSSALSPRAQSVLRILWQWRDAEARDWDRPPFHVMSNDDLLRISQKAVAGEAFSTPRMSSRRKKSFDVILALALGVPEAEWPKPEKGKRKRTTREQTAAFNRLREVRDLKAAALGIDAAILAPRQAMEAVAENPLSDALMLWQRRLLDLPPLPAFPAS
ncbi:MAG: ribonuclease D [Terrimicrobiaceae bacterium]